MRYFRYIIIPLIFGLGFSCANYGNLTGGPKDITPPQLIIEESTPLNQTQFRPKEITLVFDEWIKLKDQYKQIFISPPLKKRVNYQVKGKALNIRFDDDELLMDSSTYVIQFGSSIIDITENNPVSDLKFVFSTGDVIDSLELGGIVLDAWSKTPVENATVMLYDQFNDSLPYTQKPNYIVKTNSHGRFLLQNLRADSFKLFVLQDQNLNYLYDLDNEKIAFHKDPIFTSDSIMDLTLWLFGKTIANEVAGKDIFFNAIRVYFEKEPNNVDYFFQDTLSSFHTWHGDTMYIWMDESIDKDNKLVLLDDRKMSDTVDISFNKIRKTFKAPLRIRNNIDLQQSQFTSWALHTNQPVQLIKDSLILMDSLEIPTDSFNLKQDSNPELWYLQYPWDNSLSYKLKILPGGMKGFNDINNEDSIRLDLRIKKQEGLGNIIVHLNKKEEGAKNIIILLEKEEDLIGKRNVEAIDSTTTIEFNDLSASNYQLRIIYDRNNNGYWDPGNYDQYTEPEKVQIEILQALRANWDLDVTVNIGNHIIDKADKSLNEDNE